MSGWQRIKVVLRSLAEKARALAHPPKAAKALRQSSFGLNVIVSKSIPPDEAHLIGANGSRVRITNIGTNIPKEG